MSLHILRHKKWHVWNQDNEDTFTKDENEFMAKVEAEEKSSKMADMEKRIQKIKEMKGIQTVPEHPIAGRIDIGGSDCRIVFRFFAPIFSGNRSDCILRS